MKIAVSGATGLIGATLVPFLESLGYSVLRLVRYTPKTESEIQWCDSDGRATAGFSQLEDVRVVIHLAGENIASGRWSIAKKRRIVSSRVAGTTRLVSAIRQLSRPPKTLLVASAIGFYGDRGADLLNETSPAGVGFLPETCRAWEAAALEAARPLDDGRAVGIRVVNLRFGVVLSAEGGALNKMLLPFRLGLGGVLGSGEQYMSWIGIEDVVRAIQFCIAQETIEGPVNLVAPAPVTNREFTDVLGRVLCRPTLFTVPGLLLRITLGEMAENLLLGSTRVVPERLLNAGFRFDLPELEPCLRSLLK